MTLFSRRTLSLPLLSCALCFCVSLTLTLSPPPPVAWADRLHVQLNESQCPPSLTHTHTTREEEFKCTSEESQLQIHSYCRCGFISFGFLSLSLFYQWTAIEWFAMCINGTREMRLVDLLPHRESVFFFLFQQANV